MADWQPIETAPTEGRQMFVVCGFGVRHGTYDTDPYCVWRGAKQEFVRWPHDFQPTHWLPLPPHGVTGLPTADIQHEDGSTTRVILLADAIDPPRTCGVEVRSAEQLADGFPRWDEQGRRITDGVLEPGLGWKTPELTEEQWRAEAGKAGVPEVSMTMLPQDKAALNAAYAQAKCRHQGECQNPTGCEIEGRCVRAEAAGEVPRG